MVLIDHVTESHLRDGRRAMRILSAGTVALAVLLVVAGALLDRPPIPASLDAAFAVAWITVGLLIITMLVLRVRLGAKERKAWANARRAKPARAVRALHGPRQPGQPARSAPSANVSLQPTAPAAARFFPGPPVVAELRLLLLAIIYLGGALWLAAGFAAAWRHRNDGLLGASVFVLIASMVILALLVWGLRGLGRRWRRKPG
jgi:hypothetical protein